MSVTLSDVAAGRISDISGGASLEDAIGLNRKLMAAKDDLSLARKQLQASKSAKTLRNSDESRGSGRKQKGRTIASIESNDYDNFDPSTAFARIVALKLWAMRMSKKIKARNISSPTTGKSPRKSKDSAGSARKGSVESKGSRRLKAAKTVPASSLSKDAKTLTKPTSVAHLEQKNLPHVDQKNVPHFDRKSVPHHEQRRGTHLDQRAGMKLNQKRVQLDNKVETFHHEPYQPEKKAKKKTKKKKKKLTAAQRKEIKRQEANEDTRLLFRDQMRREVKMSKMNEEKIWLKWNAVVDEISLVEMREDLQDWMQKTQHQIQNQNDLIETCLEGIRNTEELSTKSYEQYCQMLKFIEDSHHTCVQSIKNCYETEASDMLKHFDEDLREQTSNSDMLKLEREKNFFARLAQGEAELEVDLLTFNLKEEKQINTGIVARYELRDQILRKMRNLHKQLGDFIVELNCTLSRNNQSLRQREELTSYHTSHRNIRHKNNIIKRSKLQELQNLRTHMLDIELRANQKINQFQQELKYFIEVRHFMVEAMNEDRNDFNRKLVLVTEESENLIKKYKDLVKQGELLLSLIARNRKLQTEREKIIPPKYIEAKEAPKPTLKLPECNTKGWWSSKETSSQSDDDVWRLRTLSMKEHLDLSEEDFLSMVELFKKFLHTESIALAEVLVLQKEKARLKEDNQRIIEYIKTLGVTDDNKIFTKYLQVSSAPVDIAECP